MTSTSTHRLSAVTGRVRRAGAARTVLSQDPDPRARSNHPEAPENAAPTKLKVRPAAVINLLVGLALLSWLFCSFTF